MEGLRGSAARRSRASRRGRQRSIALLVGECQRAKKIYCIDHSSAMMRLVPPTRPNDEEDASGAAMPDAEEIDELLPHAVRRPLVTESRNGFTVVKLSRRSPIVTTALVDDLLSVGIG